jgi:hypothetical protein
MYGVPIVPEPQAKLKVVTTIPRRLDQQPAACWIPYEKRNSSCRDNIVAGWQGLRTCIGTLSDFRMAYVNTKAACVPVNKEIPISTADCLPDH